MGKLLSQAMTADAYDFSGEKIQSREKKSSSMHDMFLWLVPTSATCAKRIRRLVQITLCIKWRKITGKTTQILSKLSSETSH